MAALGFYMSHASQLTLTTIFTTEGYITVWIHNAGASSHDAAQDNHYSGVNIQTTSITEEPPILTSFSTLKRKTLTTTKPSCMPKSLA